MKASRHETGHYVRPDFTKYSDGQLNAYLAHCYSGNFEFDAEFQAAMYERNARADAQSL